MYKWGIPPEVWDTQVGTFESDIFQVGVLFYRSINGDPVYQAQREAIQKGDVKAAGEQYRLTASALDKSVQKGILHANTASRYKSRLNARVKALATKKSA